MKRRQQWEEIFRKNYGALIWNTLTDRLPTSAKPLPQPEDANNEINDESASSDDGQTNTFVDERKAEREAERMFKKADDDDEEVATAKTLLSQMPSLEDPAPPKRRDPRAGLSVLPGGGGKGLDFQAGIASTQLRKGMHGPSEQLVVKPSFNQSPKKGENLIPKKVVNEMPTLPFVETTSPVKNLWLPAKTSEKPEPLTVVTKDAFVDMLPPAEAEPVPIKESSKNISTRVDLPKDAKIFRYQTAELYREALEDVLGCRVIITGSAALGCACSGAPGAEWEYPTRYPSSLDFAVLPFHKPITCGEQTGSKSHFRWKSSDPDDIVGMIRKGSVLTSQVRYRELQNLARFLNDESNEWLSNTYWIVETINMSEAILTSRPKDRPKKRKFKESDVDINIVKRIGLAWQPHFQEVAVLQSWALLNDGLMPLWTLLRTWSIVHGVSFSGSCDQPGPLHQAREKAAGRKCENIPLPDNLKTTTYKTEGFNRVYRDEEQRGHVYGGMHNLALFRIAIEALRNKSVLTHPKNSVEKIVELSYGAANNQVGSLECVVQRAHSNFSHGGSSLLYRWMMIVLTYLQKMNSQPVADPKCPGYYFTPSFTCTSLNLTPGLTEAWANVMRDVVKETLNTLGVKPWKSKDQQVRRAENQEYTAEPGQLFADRRALQAVHMAYRCLNCYQAIKSIANRQDRPQCTSCAIAQKKKENEVEFAAIGGRGRGAQPVAAESPTRGSGRGRARPVDLEKPTVVMDQNTLDPNINHDGCCANCGREFPWLVGKPISVLCVNCR